MLSRTKIVFDLFRAFASADRSFVERTFTAGFSFSSPLDVGLDRAGYFDRCWPGAGKGQHFNFVRILESGNNVVVTYEVPKTGGDGWQRNTEVFTFDGNRIGAVEVYFGWSVPVETSGGLAG